LQYAGLALYVVGESLLFAPLLYIAAYYSDPTVIPTAAILTLLMFAGLTTIAFTTRKDFSFLGGILKLTGFVALGLIVCSILFDFTLGLVFSVGMVAFASAAILYDTSKVMHHYQPHQYVAASLQLFASVALLFWYILRIVMRARR
ncbi:MAG: Bax inhibitor-1 family protein, partial [Cyanobacteria bacterium J06555_12]